MVKIDEFGYVLILLGMNFVYGLKMVIVQVNDYFFLFEYECDEVFEICILFKDIFDFFIFNVEFGWIMEKYYMQFEIMKVIIKVVERVIIEEFFYVLVNVVELLCIL